jgi:hypothetical protein
VPALSERCLRRQKEGWESKAQWTCARHCGPRTRAAAHPRAGHERGRGPLLQPPPRRHRPRGVRVRQTLAARATAGSPRGGLGPLKITLLPLPPAHPPPHEGVPRCEHEPLRSAPCVPPARAPSSVLPRVEAAVEPGDGRVGPLACGRRRWPGCGRGTAHACDGRTGGPGRTGPADSKAVEPPARRAGRRVPSLARLAHCAV